MPTLIKRISQRSRKAVEAMLQTAPDTKSPPDKFAIDIMLAAILAGGRANLFYGPQIVRATRPALSVLHDGRDR